MTAYISLSFQQPLQYHDQDIFRQFYWATKILGNTDSMAVWQAVLRPTVEKVAKSVRRTHKIGKKVRETT